MITRRFYWILATIGLLRLVLAGWFAFHAPFSETLDEWNHLKYVLFVAVEHQLPTEADYPTEIPLTAQNFVQYNQPPLYYLVSGMLFWTMNQRHYPSSPIPNPRPMCLNMPYNYYLHGTGTHSADLLRMVWLGRSINILLGVLGVCLTAIAIRCWLPDHPRVALLSAFFLAIYPSAIWNSVWINNDTLLTVWGAGGILCIGALSKQNAQSSIYLLLMAGAALLTKLSGIVLLAVSGFAILRFWIISRKWYQLSLSIGLGILLIGGYISLNMSRCGLPLCRLHLYELRFSTWQQFWYFLQRPDYGSNWLDMLQSATVPALYTSHRTVPAPLHIGGLVVGVLGIMGAIISFWCGQYRQLIGWSVMFVMLACLLAMARVWWFTYAVTMPVRYISIAFPAVAILCTVGWVYTSHYLGKYFLIIPTAWWLFVALLSPVLFHCINCTSSYTMPVSLSSNVIDNHEIQVQGADTQSESTPLTITAYRVDEQAIYLYWNTDNTPVLDTPLYVAMDLLDAQDNWIGRCAYTIGGTQHNAIFWDTLTTNTLRQRFDFTPEQVKSAHTIELRFFHTITEHDLYTNVAQTPFAIRRLILTNTP